jgi:hypothetical protein
MGFIIDPGKMLEIEVGIDLGRGQVGVPEEFLNGTKIS